MASANGTGQAGAADRGLPLRPPALYAIALALVALTVLACWLIAPGLGGLSLYLFLLPAVLAAGMPAARSACWTGGGHASCARSDPHARSASKASERALTFMARATLQQGCT